MFNIFFFLYFSFPTRKQQPKHLPFTIYQKRNNILLFRCVSVQVWFCWFVWRMRIGRLNACHCPGSTRLFQLILSPLISYMETKYIKTKNIIENVSNWNVMFQCFTVPNCTGDIFVTILFFIFYFLPKRVPIFHYFDSFRLILICKTAKYLVTVFFLGLYIYTAKKGDRKTLKLSVWWLLGIIFQLKP